MAWTSIESPKDLSDITDQIRDGRLTFVSV
jgi:hypothetical protein